ncbi:glycosyltransferase family 2 protein [Argonema antarcticum]|uniref:glycosyltransferase family 2 protein n=1 Tax=Argonema antarcticum TaxID=2942763 RepID=UPI002010D657|nr:glycosyltransferase family 2 protein [Argonema antarcticum]
MPDGSEWPRISVVTPSYNYGRFIEETIRSVLLQGYPNLEYIIIDGGSKDNTVEIIKKYEKYLDYWISEPDAGQTDAINKGFQHCTGDLFVWLNADDSYANTTCLQTVSKLYLSGYEFIAGSCRNLFLDGREEIIHSLPVDFYQYLKFWLFWGLPQPSVFVAKKIADKCFPLYKELYGLMDYQFFLRSISQNPKTIYINQVWTEVKYHGNSKTEQNYSGALAEYYKVALSESKKLPSLARLWFLRELEDYMTLQPAIYSQALQDPIKIIALLASRPTLVCWPIFWKLIIQAVVRRKI